MIEFSRSAIEEVAIYARIEEPRIGASSHCAIFTIFESPSFLTALRFNRLDFRSSQVRWWRKDLRCRA